jgi:hypothetical protein
MVRCNELVHRILCIKIMTKVWSMVKWKVGLGAHIVRTWSRVCGKIKHLDMVGDHINQHRVDRKICCRVDRRGKLSWFL